MTGYFTSLAGQKYQVTVGSATGTLTLSDDPVHLTWDRPDHIFVSVRTMSCNLRVKTSTDLSTLYTDDPLGCVVRIDEMDANDTVTNCIFYGFLTPQEWDAPFSGLNDEVEMVAVDALAVLKQLKYTAVETNYPSLLTSQSIVERACALVGFTTVPTMPSSTAAVTTRINESAFLPRYQDASEYSDNRKSWYEVLQAIATWEGLVFMQSSSDAFTLLALDIQSSVTSDSATSIDMRGSDSASADVRMSIEPAKSRVIVDYSDLSAMQFVPEITEDRMEDDVIAETSVSDGTKKTATKYFVAKDWISHDSRSACGAAVCMTNSLTDESETKFCIVGPAHMTYPTINTQDVDLFSPSFCISLSAWARDDMDVDADGYDELNIKTKASNFNPVIGLRFYNPVTEVGYTYTKELALNGNEGFTSCDIRIYTWGASGENFTGYFTLTIPDGCVVTGTSVSMNDTAFSFVASKKVRLDKVENDGIVELTAAGWNDSVSIEAQLRSSVNGYSASDIVDSGLLDKFPYCETSQFEVPRKRFRTTIDGIHHACDLLSDANVSAQKLLVDGGDIDLRRDETTVELIETWVSV